MKTIVALIIGLIVMLAGLCLSYLIGFIGVVSRIIEPNTPVSMQMMYGFAWMGGIVALLLLCYALGLLIMAIAGVDDYD